MTEPETAGAEDVDLLTLLGLLDGLVECLAGDVTARCVGACGLAPAVVIDDDLEGKLTPEDTLERVRDVASRTAAPAEAKA